MENHEELMKITKFLVITLLAGATLFLGSCTIQAAYRNKNTDCGFTHDDIHGTGKRDPMIFYGNPKKD